MLRGFERRTQLRKKKLDLRVLHAERKAPTGVQIWYTTLVLVLAAD